MESRSRPPHRRRPSKNVVWENVAALMRHRWGKENVNRLARDAKTAVGNAARLKEQGTSIGMDILDAIAWNAFKLETWQLFVPGLDPAHLPVAVPGEKEDEPSR